MNTFIWIVDVRSPYEFAEGNVPGSVNIPLHELPDHLEEIIKHQETIVLCCESGARSRQATHYLRSRGISNCISGGNWREMRASIENAA